MAWCLVGVIAGFAAGYKVATLETVLRGRLTPAMLAGLVADDFQEGTANLLTKSQEAAENPSPPTARDAETALYFATLPWASVKLFGHDFALLIGRTHPTLLPLSTFHEVTANRKVVLRRAGLLERADPHIRAAHVEFSAERAEASRKDVFGVH